MTTQIAATLFADPAPAHRLERAAAALTAHGFTVEILDDAAAARTRVQELIPEGTCVFTGASETLRLSGIEADINASGRYQAGRPRFRFHQRMGITRTCSATAHGTRSTLGFGLMARRMSWHSGIRAPRSP